MRRTGRRTEEDIDNDDNDDNDVEDTVAAVANTWDMRKVKEKYEFTIPSVNITRNA